MVKIILYLSFLTTFIISGCAQKNRQNVQIIDPIESLPKFVGGDSLLLEYLKKNNHWKAGQLTIEGKVIVGFIINEDGEVKNVEVLRSLHPTCDKVAVKLVEGMPNWIPAEEDGKPVSRRMALPISFNGL